MALGKQLITGSRILNSISVKCLLGSALTVMVVSMATYLLDSSYKTGRVVEHLSKRAEDVTRLISMQFGEGMQPERDAPVADHAGHGQHGVDPTGRAPDNVSRLTEHAAHLIVGAAPDLAGGLVMGTDGDILYQSDSIDLNAAMALGRLAIEAGTPQKANDGLLVAIPVFDKALGVVTGVTVTEWTTQHVLADLQAMQTKTLSFGTLVAAVGLIALTLFFRRCLSQPLLQLNQSMKRIGAREYETAVPFTGRGDEIGAMAVQLDQFRAALSRASAAQREAAFKSAAFEGSTAPMMMVDTEFRVTFLNPSCKAMLDRMQDALADRWPRNDQSAWQGARLGDMYDFSKLADDVARQGADALPVSLPLRVGNRHLRVKANAALDDNGCMIGAVVEWSDRTNSQHDAAVLSTIDAHQVRLEFDANGVCIEVNDNAARKIGIDAEHVQGTRFSAVFPTGQSDADLPDDLAAAVLNGDAIQGCFDVCVLVENAKLKLDGAFAGVIAPDGTMERSVFLGTDVTAARLAVEGVEAERARVAQEQQNVVEALGHALQMLSEGDLTSDIAQVFPAEYEALRQNFNRALSALREAIGAVMQSAESIRSETSEITSAADDLSRRTEKQAATLEETAAALDELTTSVRSAAESADAASKMSAEAQQNAQQGGEVAREAVQAMDEIKNSSQEISKITSVIDDIAFQTNLLALNAGVEAARAGEAGRGFAVVATEVRALAQRSSDAAREINALISASGDQVQHGVDLVDRTGTALGAIVHSVSDISERVTAIASSAREQSNGLNEVNTAVNELDHVTQQNAAMFEETTAASHALTGETDGLAAAVSAFRMGGAQEDVAAPTMVSSGPEPAPVTPAPVAMVAGNAALQIDIPDPDEDGWEEF